MFSFRFNFVGFNFNTRNSLDMNTEKLTHIIFILLLFVVLQGPLFASAESDNCNIIENGDFLNGTNNWSLYTYNSASGDIYIQENGFCKIDIFNGSSSSWHLALRQNNIVLENGKTYEISYQAYADAERTYSVIVSDINGNQYKYIGESLTTSIQNYVSTFTMNDASDVNAVLSFNSGNSSSNTYFKDIVLKEINCIDEVCNTVQNSGFENGLDSWDIFNHNSASGNLLIDNSGFCKIEILEGSTSMWHLALRQSAITLENAKTYDISYNAYADANRNVSIILSDQSGNQYHYASQSLSTNNQSYNHSFVMDDITDFNSVFSLNVGNSSINVYVDNIMISTQNCEESSCVESLDITNDVINDKTFKVNSVLRSNATMNANVAFKAGESILLYEEFETLSNYTFEAYIEACEIIDENCETLFQVGSTAITAYESTAVCDVSDGISGMWISRNNTDVYWHIADHDYNLHEDDHYLFAVSSSGNLLWSGSLSGVNVGNKDIEGITGFRKNNIWYLAIWENRGQHDELQIIAEPIVSSNQSLVFGAVVPVSKIISPQGGIGESGNVESITWDESDDNLYLVQRGGDTYANSPRQEVWRIPNFSSLENNATPNEIFVASIQGRPSNAASNIHVGVGDAAISPAGDIFAMIGVGGIGSDKNEFLFWWTRNPANETWTDVLSANPIPSPNYSIETSSMGENIALSPNMNLIFYGNDWGSGANNKIYQHNLDYIICE